MNNKYIKQGVGAGAVFLTLVITGACVQKINTEAGYETVLIDKPFFTFIDKGGIRPETQKPGSGWYWRTTEALPSPTTPIRKDENFDNLSTSNGSFVDYNTYLNLRITDSPKLYGLYGTKWYENNIQEQYREIVRKAVRKYRFDSLMSDPATGDLIEKEVRSEVEKMLLRIQIPASLVDLSLGKATPNKPVLDEMDVTSTQEQRAKSMSEKSKADISEQRGRIESEKLRKEAEERRADADNAYQRKMGLSAEQYVQLQYINKMSEACSSGNATCVIGNVPGLTIK